MSGRARSHRWSLAAAALIAVVVAGGGVAGARGRLVRALDGRNGLPTASVYAVGQDHAGFIWIGSIGGLLRYDGHEVRRVAPDAIHNFVDLVRADTDGSVLVREPYAVWRVAGDVATRVEGPDGKPLGRVRDLLVAGDGGLWVVADGAVWRRGSDGAWTRREGPIEDDGVGHLRKGGRAGGLGLTTMRRRAEEIGGSLRLSTPAGGGTRVELVFAPGRA